MLNSAQLKHRDSLSAVDLRSLETYYYLLGASALVPGMNPSIERLRSRVVEANFRKSEALSLEFSAPPLEQARVLLARGKTLGALALIESHGPNASGEDRIEWLLEEARARNNLGAWAKAARACETALAMSPQGATLICLLQVQSVALFESGDFRSALESVDKVICLGERYPKGLAVFYAKGLRAKLRARLAGMDEGMILLGELWTELKTQMPENLDARLALLRIQSDFRRLRGESYLAETTAAFHLARLMGDDLYEALALVEVAFAEDPLLRKTALDLLANSPSPDLLRARETLTDPRSGETARSLTDYRAKSPPASSAHTSALNGVTSLVFLDSGWLIQLETRIQGKKNLQPKVRRLLKEIGCRKMEPGDLFRRIWRQKYSADLHAENLRTVAKRLKSQTNITLERDEIGRFGLRKCIAVSELL